MNEWGWKRLAGGWSSASPWVALAVAGLVSLESHALSTTSTSARVGQNHPSDGTGPFSGSAFDARPGPSSSGVAFETSGASGSASANASAHAVEGRLGALSATRSEVRSGLRNVQGDLDGSEAVTARAEASAQWADDLTITAPGLSGAGTIHARLLLSGTVSAGGDPFLYIRNPDGSRLDLYGRSFAGLEIAGSGLDGGVQPWDDACAAVGLGGRIACANADNMSLSGPANSYSLGGVTDLDVVIPFTFGSSTRISYWIRATGGADAGTSYYQMSVSAESSGLADMESTLAWGGISGIFDAAGDPVTDFSVASVSGFDYRNAYPVPEPATATLLLAGLAGLGAEARRRSRANARGTAV